ncbi:YgfZ/GcvT domain-containing protein [Leekyejoonella antrihumi]|uniref:Folate-binding protein YgfZ n=1 Tax=Leekyejoonella antrihumi TaxID=1660198 RepID=A0A563E9K1_9MICO|nr:folate-binding protein YgfZ [Leekyejoonella antrihumi]TWP38891.1 folate-binding protein YgfZ [Leekyejoonella antrihumi]
MSDTTAVSTLLSTPGAVEDVGRDAGVASHYGDPLREQRLLTDGLGVVDLSHRGVVQVTGPDRLTWLHSMTTQKIDDLPPYTSVESLVLSPKGHIEHSLHLVDDGETTWITVEPGTAPALVEWLRSMQFMLRVEVQDVTPAYAVLGEPINAESTAQELESHGVIAWRDPWPAMGPDSAAYGRTDPHPATGRAWRELIVPRDTVLQMVDDRPLAGMWALEALRIDAWRPRVLWETDHRTIPHELDLLRTAVHLHKGCYRGQETIARVHNLGKPPRRLVFLHLDGSGHTLPDVGAELVVSGAERPIGRITSVGRHYEDGPIALAVIKRNTPVDAVLEAGTVSAAQTVIVEP